MPLRAKNAVAGEFWNEGGVETLLLLNDPVLLRAGLLMAGLASLSMLDAGIGVASLLKISLSCACNGGEQESRF